MLLQYIGFWNAYLIYLSEEQDCNWCSIKQFISNTNKKGEEFLNRPIRRCHCRRHCRRPHCCCRRRPSGRRPALLEGFPWCLRPPPRMSPSWLSSRRGQLSSSWPEIGKIRIVIQFFLLAIVWFFVFCSVRSIRNMKVIAYISCTNLIHEVCSAISATRLGCWW